MSSECANSDLPVSQDNIRDITDSLINHCEDRKLDENSNVQLSDEKIVGIVNDLFGAGSPSFSEQLMSPQKQAPRPRVTAALLPLGFDTVATSLTWSVTYLVAHPEVQERLYQELSKQTHLQTSAQSSRKAAHACQTGRPGRVPRANVVQMLQLARSSRSCTAVTPLICLCREERGSGSHPSSLR